MSNHIESKWWCWVLSWFGLRVRETIALECENEHQHTITIWKKPDEDGWDVIQREVQREFDKLDSTNEC